MIGCRSVTSGLLCLVDTNLRQRVQIRKDTTFILLIFFLFIYLLFGHTTWPVGSHFPDSDQTWAPLQRKRRLSITGPPGKSLHSFFFPESCIISLIIVLVSLCSTWSGGNLILVKLCGPCYPFLLKFSSKFLSFGKFGRIPNPLHHLGV